MCSDKRNFIYRVHKDHRNPGNRWNVNFRHGNIFKIWAKNRRPRYTCVVWEIGAKSCTVCQFFLKLNSFLKVLAHIPTLPAYTGFFWIWHKNLPVFSTGHPTPDFGPSSAFFPKFKHVFSLYYVFCTVFWLIGAQNFKSWYTGFKKYSLHRTFLDWECLLIVSSNALIHCSLSSESRADKKINNRWVNVHNYAFNFISTLAVKLPLVWLAESRKVNMYETGRLFNSFALKLPVTAREDPHPLPLVMSSALTFTENFVS